MTYRVENNVIYTQDENLTYSKTIKNHLSIENTIVIRLELMGMEDDSNNIYAIREGKQVWQVQDFAQYLGEPYAWYPGAYSGIRIYGKNPNLIIANTTGGFRYLIDPLNGKIVGEESWAR